MDADRECSADYDQFRHHSRLERAVRPDSGIRIRRQLDPGGMGDLVGSSVADPKRCLGRAIGPAAGFVLRNASI
jgi:hypothetical protein